jgi:hypothetical protein
MNKFWNLILNLSCFSFYADVYELVPCARCLGESCSEYSNISIFLFSKNTTFYNRFNDLVDLTL